MTNNAKIIKFPELDTPQNETEQAQGGDYVKADTDNGYYRVANELGLALCKVHLSDRESRLVHAVMMKTFGWQKAMDWICNGQLNELTDIKQSHISDLKKGLVARNILLVQGNKVGINPIVSEWLFTKNKEIKVKITPKEGRSKKVKAPLNRVKATPKQGRPTPKQGRPTPKEGKKHPQKGNHKSQDTYTIDTNTKDSIPACIPMSSWIGFVDHRTSIKKPLTVNAASLLIKRLEGFNKQGYSVKSLLDDSIINGWSGVFPPKSPAKTNINQTASTILPVDYHVPTLLPGMEGNHER